MKNKSYRIETIEKCTRFLFVSLDTMYGKCSISGSCPKGFTPGFTSQGTQKKSRSSPTASMSKKQS